MTKNFSFLMQIVYTTTSYVSRYFPALDSVLTFPVISHYTPSTTYRPSVEGYIDNCNMTNDSTASSSGARVIIQRRPSVIKAVPRQNESTVVNGEEEFDSIDVVGFDDMNGVVENGLSEVNEIKSEEDEIKVEEGEETSRGSKDPVRSRSRRGERKRVQLVKGNQSSEDDDWKPLGRFEDRV